MKFLKAHCNAKGRALTAKRLADTAGYKGYRAINLQYGKLAKRIAPALGKHPDDVTIELLVDGVHPGAVANEEWVLIMRPPFAEALKRVGWV
jgi:hypothetical protein